MLPMRELCFPSPFFLICVAFEVAKHIAGIKSFRNMFHGPD